MSTAKQVKVTAKTAQEIGAHLELSQEAAGLLEEKMTPRAFLDRLVGKEQFPDAAGFLAHALPKVEAIKWACVCASLGASDEAEAEISPALQAAVRWVGAPTDENRRAAMAAAEKEGFGTPGACAAQAVFFSGGSMAPPNVPEVPPGEFLTAKAVACAVMLAAVMNEPEKASEKYRDFLRRGIESVDWNAPAA
jgi:hypothetical protein